MICYQRIFFCLLLLLSLRTEIIETNEKEYT